MTPPATPSGSADAPADAVRRDVRVRSPRGLHARPATDLAALANGFSATVQLCSTEQTADAKSVLNLMMLAATEGTELRLVASGSDAEAAADAVAAFFADGFGEC